VGNRSEAEDGIGPDVLVHETKGMHKAHRLCELPRNIETQRKRPGARSVDQHIPEATRARQTRRCPEDHGEDNPGLRASRVHYVGDEALAAENAKSVRLVVLEAHGEVAYVLLDYLVPAPGGSLDVV